MAEVTIEKLASDVGTTVDRLVQQFADAGITKHAGQMVSEDEKKSLLDHLSKQHGGASACWLVTIYFYTGANINVLFLKTLFNNES